jgi:DNA-binding GntR family transcriptional regulator
VLNHGTVEFAEPQKHAQHPVDRVRDMIFHQELLPGEKIHQVELSIQMGISRSPLREALRTLESEGIVTYSVNRGYVVTRLDASEFEQIYRMRELLESDLLAEIRPATHDELEQLKQYNQQISEAKVTGSIAGLIAANRRFHHGIFALSDKMLIRRQIELLWQRSEGYRATYLWLPDTQARMLDEHEEIIRALEEFDLDKLAALCTGHRNAIKRTVVGMLDSQTPSRLREAL